MHQGDDFSATMPSEAWFAARVTGMQFHALAQHLGISAVRQEVDALPHFGAVRRGKTCDLATVRQWTANGWNTEHLLRVNREHLEGDALAHSLQWAFPQAYYSAFALSLAYYNAVGYTERSHSAVIKKAGLEMLAGRYPPRLSFALTGGNVRTYHNIQHVVLPNNLQFEPTVPEQCLGRICQFLNATRTLDLDGKKGDLNFKTHSGAKKKKLKPHEWEKVSEALGPTSLLSLLYRKRIKGNYQSIDTLVSGDLNPSVLYEHLIATVGTANHVHELYLARALGKKDFGQLLPANTGVRYPFLTERLDACLARAA